MEKYEQWPVPRPRLPVREILRRPNRSSLARLFAAELGEARLNSSSGEADPEARIPLDVTDSVHRRGTFPCAAISWHRSDLSVPAGYCSVITMIIRRLAHIRSRSALWHAADNMRYTVQA